MPLKFRLISSCSSVLPKLVAGQAAGCTTQTPGATVHADGEDPRIAGPTRSVPTCGPVQIGAPKTPFYYQFVVRNLLAYDS